MRYTKAALLIFGLGLAVGFAVVVGEFADWEREAAAIMALGLVLVPVGLFADGHGVAALRWLASRFSHSKRKKPRPRTRSRTPRRKLPARAAGRTPRRKRS
jgi:hypothetical protein